MSDIKQKLIRLYRSGKLTHTEIAVKVGLSYATVIKFFNTNKFEHLLPDPPRNMRKRIEKGSSFSRSITKAYNEYIQKGYTLQQLSEKYQLSAGHIGYMFRKHGLVCRVTGKRRKHFYCRKGHLLKKGEYQKNGCCSECRKEKEERKIKGVCEMGHLMTTENIYKWKNKQGREFIKCRSCQKLAQERYKARNVNK